MKKFKTQLLCTQCTDSNYESVVRRILFKFGNMLDGDITVIKPHNYGDDNTDLYCIYNIIKDDTNNKKLQYPINTILIQRKSGTNTLYTINALNELIWCLNNGKFDKNYKVQWDDYKNMFLLIKNKTLSKLSFKPYKTFSKQNKDNSLEPVI